MAVRAGAAVCRRRSGSAEPCAGEAGGQRPRGKAAGRLRRSAAALRVFVPAQHGRRRGGPAGYAGAVSEDRAGVFEQSPRKSVAAARGGEPQQEPPVLQQAPADGRAQRRADRRRAGGAVLRLGRGPAAAGAVPRGGAPVLLRGSEHPADRLCAGPERSDDPLRPAPGPGAAEADPEGGVRL